MRRKKRRKRGRPKGVKFMGEHFKSRIAVKKQLHITHRETVEAFRTKSKMIINPAGDIGRYKLRDKPLIFRQFGIRRVHKRSVVRNIPMKGDVRTKKNITFRDGAVRIIIELTMKITWGHYWVIRKKQFGITKQKKTGIEKRIGIVTRTDHIRLRSQILADQYAREVAQDAEAEILETRIISRLTGQELKFKNMKLSGIRYELGYETIDVDEGDCVIKYLKSRYSKLKNQTETLPKHGVSIKKIVEFCKINRIKCIAYDINKNVIGKYMPTKHAHKKSLIFIAYSNHIYPLKNKFLRKSRPSYGDVVYVDNIKQEMTKLLNNKIVPQRVQLSGGDVCSFVHDNKKYIQNDEHKQCLEILTKFGLEDKIYDSIKISYLGNLIEKMYIGKPIESFFPESATFCKGGFNYKNTKLYNDKSIHDDIKCIDKNKGYAWCLSHLPYLISVDIRYSKMFKNIKDIIDHYLYIAKPKYSTILMPTTNIYPGYHLNICKKEGIEFEVLEGITTKKQQNYYKLMVEDLYERLDENDFKNIINIMIGKMQKTSEIFSINKFDRICNKDEAKRIEGFKIPLDIDHVIVTTVKEDVRMYTKKPIAFQVIDYMRYTTYMKMKEMNLTDKDIVEVHTDSIAYINHSYPKNMNKKLDGWKIEYWQQRCEATESIISDSTYTFKPSITYNNTIYNDHAGAGKTETIKKMVPDLKDYIILTPTHKARLCYVKKNYNAKVYQTYTEQNMVPKENTIIVDEHGMFDIHGTNLLIKCMLLNKRVISFGDYNQLLPCGCIEPLNSKAYLNTFFRHKTSLGTNYRNNFTREYYDDIISGKLNAYKEVKKHSTKKFYDAEYVICYRNVIVDMYNERMMKHIDLKWGQIGLKIICKTNRFVNKGIYNNMIELITKKYVIQKGRGKPKTMYELSNGTILTESQLNSKTRQESNFKPAYALTTYGVQGDSISSYYYAPEDKKFIDSRLAYTVISRLKQKIIKQKLPEMFILSF